MKLGYHTITWGGVVGHPAGVTSVKDLYYLAHGSTERALADIADAGYTGIELFDGNLVEYGDRRDEFRGLLRTHGLELVAVYCGANFVFREILTEELWRIDRAAELAADLGAEHLVLGGGASRAAGQAPEDLDRLAEGVAAAGDIADRYGLTPSYHPHLGTIVETPDALDAIMEKIDMGLCPDLAHLAAGGGDPAAIIRRYHDRIPYVHLKDLSRATQRFMPLGAGDLDLADVVAALGEIAYDGWMTVELDEYAGDPAEAARQSRAFLRPHVDAS
jgi:inosose dehydratase